MFQAFDSLLNDPATAAVCAVLFVTFSHFLTHFRRASLPTYAPVRASSAARQARSLRLSQRYESVSVDSGGLRPAVLGPDVPTVQFLQEDVGKGGAAL